VVGGSPADGGFAAGSRIAGYLLQEQIGRGGMAVVFRAHDERLGRTVALKILAPVLSADEAYRQRFMRESRAAAAVDEPHIIPVFEAGDASGVLFIAMRFVRGGDVRSLVRQRGSLPPGRVAEIVSQVASALDAAHARGLVHRDVKPANMLLDVGEETGRPDHVYLSDFGLSKEPLAPGRLTATGQFLGTLDYMSPEQFSGRSVDARTDQYALACTAYEMLTGAPPFQRDAGMAVIYAQLSLPPPTLTSRRPDLPAGADEVLARALAKVPADRYLTCREFADALRAVFGLRPYRFDQEQAPVPSVPSAPARAPVSRHAQVPERAPGSRQAPATSVPSADGTPTDVDTVGPLSVIRQVSSMSADATGSGGPGGRSGRSRWRSPGRIAVAVVLLAALAGGAYVLLRDTSGQSFGQVIFRADFSRDTDGWMVIPDAAQGRYRDGAYDVGAQSSGDIEIALPGNVAVLYPSAPPVLSLEVTARSLGNPVQDTQYGLTCRSDDQGNRYLFSVEGKSVLIAKSTHTGSNYVYSPLTPLTAAPVSAGTPLALRADCITVSGQRAVRLVFWVNGRKLLDVTDKDPLANGTVGFFTNFYGKKVITSEAEFRNFVVSR
jgi:serine/threonine-protein kinase